jgi:hypothetical protein
LQTPEAPVSRSAEALAYLADCIGEDAAMALANAFGGTRLYVPHEPGEHHPITVAIGPANAEKLAAWAGGGSIDVPKQAARQAKVRELYERGALTISGIARETSYSERHVYRLIEAGRDENQADLFDD